jgi:transposase InsO family protein
MNLASTYPIRLICQVMGYPRSSYYYQSGEGNDAEIETAIEQVAERWPKYGYRRITVQLRREKQLAVNSKRVRRLMRKKGLQAQIQRKKRRTTNSEHAFPRYPNLVQALEVVRPDQVWVADITYIRLLTEFVYLAVIMDVFTRCIRGWYLGRSLDQDLTLMALKRGLVAHAPEVHHSDQGVQYAATAYVDVLKAHQIAISMAEVGEAWQNGYAERLVRTIKEEEVDLSDYRDYADAYGQIGRFLDDVYMHKRIHSALGYLTPVEFESQWLAQQTAVAVVAAEVVQL